MLPSHWDGFSVYLYRITHFQKASWREGIKTNETGNNLIFLDGPPLFSVIF